MDHASITSSVKTELLTGKIAVVTGAASGIGRATAALLAENGARVIRLDLQAGAEGGDSRESFVCNVADEDSVASAAGHIRQLTDHVDILVNCAGVPQGYTPIDAVRLEDWQRIMNVNAASIFLMVKHFLPLLRKSASASVVNICSSMATRPRPGIVAYCASKAAAVAITQSLALELAPERIRVNGVNPAATYTPMLKGFTGQATLEEAAMKFDGIIPLGRLVQPQDVAGAVLYLSSPLADLITGSIIPVDGGRTI